MIYKYITETLERSYFNTFCKTFSPEEIFNDIYIEFSQYFENKQNLNFFSNSYLIFDYIGYELYPYNDMKEKIKDLLKIFWDAKKINNKQIYLLINNYNKNNNEKAILSISFAHLFSEINKKNENDYIFATFDYIENICELHIKNMLNLLIKVNEILNKSTNFNENINLSFGGAYNQLIELNFFKKLINLSLLKIPMNQWRNISCHKSYKILNNQIICNYGKNENKEIIIKDKKDLLIISQEIYNIFQTINYCIKFFTYDNISSRKNCINKNFESLEVSLTTRIYIYNILIKNIEYFPSKISVTLFDKKNRTILELFNLTPILFIILGDSYAHETLELIIKNNIHDIKTQVKHYYIDQFLDNNINLIDFKKKINYIE